MNFDSISFAVFLPIVFILYWFSTNKSFKRQNILLLIASYFFYSCWDIRFLSLLLLSTLIDFLIGLKISDSENRANRKAWLVFSIVINLGLLVFFKYYNFFASSFSELLHGLNIQSNEYTLNLILPIGISFYTFHGLSYVIDIYTNKIQPEKNFINYAVFVSFFPLLVAGPIERATHLLPQIQKERHFDYLKSVDGLRQILWGLFKKLVIANHCAYYVEIIFSDSGVYSGSTLLLGAFLFFIQVYTDFSAYSDIALGVARLFGIELLQNFSFPFFSRNLTEFWRRWHISLSSWFRDYLYIPLGGSRNGKFKTIRNIFLIFLLGGLWHGANWTFLVWGFVNALYLIPSIFFNNNLPSDIVAKGKLFPTFLEFLYMLRTFILIALVCVFFRAENLPHAFNYFSGLFTESLFSLPTVKPTALFFLILFFTSVEWLGREQTHPLKNLAFKQPKWLRLFFYYLIVLSIYLSKVPEQKFIYFQF